MHVELVHSNVDDLQSLSSRRHRLYLLMSSAPSDEPMQFHSDVYAPGAPFYDVLLASVPSTAGSAVRSCPGFGDGFLPLYGGLPGKPLPARRSLSDSCLGLG